MMEIMDGNRRRGIPNRNWADDIKDWCKRGLHNLRIAAQSKTVDRNDDVGQLRTFCQWTMMMVIFTQMCLCGCTHA